MTIDLCFKGWMLGVEVTHVTDFSNLEFGIRELTVSQIEGSSHLVELDDGKAYSRTMTQEEFVARLKDGRFAVSLSEMLKAPNHKDEVEIFDFELNT